MDAAASEQATWPTFWQLARGRRRQEGVTGATCGEGEPQGPARWNPSRGSTSQWSRASLAEANISGVAPRETNRRGLRAHRNTGTGDQRGHRDLQIIACAGSGKTRVVAHRVIHILQSVEGMQPENVVAFTFTEKALEAREEAVSRGCPTRSSLPVREPMLPAVAIPTGDVRGAFIAWGGARRRRASPVH